jgi:hypothetical protein
MSKKNNKKSSFNYVQTLQRKLAKQSGFFDGRFKEKVVPNKKKKEEKRLSRKKVDIAKEE